MYLIAIRHKNIIKMNEKAVKIAMSSRAIRYNCSDFQMAFSNDPKKNFGLFNLLLLKYSQKAPEVATNLRHK